MDIKIKAIDECCREVSIFEGDERAEQGVWCSKSKMLHVGAGEFAGIFQNEQEILTELVPVEIHKTVYRRRL